MTIECEKIRRNTFEKSKMLKSIKKVKANQNNRNDNKKLCKNKVIKIKTK